MGIYYKNVSGLGDRLNNFLLIFLGSGVGGLLRYGVSSSIHMVLSRDFPYGTMIVNITGCFLMGVLFIVTTERFGAEGASLRSLLLIGLLGGYTTFSSFSIETMLLFVNGRLLSGLMNIFLTTTLCLIATWLGIIGGRSL